jgi:hypothetical protein
MYGMEGYLGVVGACLNAHIAVGAGDVELITGERG